MHILQYKLKNAQKDLTDKWEEYNDLSDELRNAMEELIGQDVIYMQKRGYDPKFNLRKCKISWVYIHDGRLNFQLRIYSLVKENAFLCDRLFAEAHEIRLLENFDDVFSE